MGVFMCDDPDIGKPLDIRTSNQLIKIGHVFVVIALGIVVRGYWITGDMRFAAIASVSLLVLVAGWYRAAYTQRGIQVTTAGITRPSFFGGAQFIRWSEITRVAQQGIILRLESRHRTLAIGPWMFREPDKFIEVLRRCAPHATADWPAIDSDEGPSNHGS